MRSSASSCAEPLVPMHPACQQPFNGLLQRDAAVREYARALAAPILDARYGAKRGDRTLTMLAANVQRLSNKCAATTIDLCYGGLDINDSPDSVLYIPPTLASLLRAHLPCRDVIRSPKELYRVETSIEGKFNDLQATIVTGQATTRDLIEARRRIGEMQKVLAEYDAVLEREINKATGVS
jgi:hypothetical protein